VYRRNQLAGIACCMMIYSLANLSYAATKTYQTNCGKARFFVNVLNNGYAFDNSYRLSAETAAGFFELYTGKDEFYASCLTTSSNKPLLIFQNFCDGSACVEQNYGAVDPENFSILLQPSQDNNPNKQALSDLLGFEAPNLTTSALAFCCNEQTLQQVEKTLAPIEKDNLTLAEHFTRILTEPVKQKTAIFTLLGLLSALFLYLRKKHNRPTSIEKGNSPK